MVYCPNCGAENDNHTVHCKSCGTELRRRTRSRTRYDREICFGMPMSGRIIPLLFGCMIILWGLTELFNFNIELWALVIIFFGVSIILNVLKKPTRPYW